MQCRGASYAPQEHESIRGYGPIRAYGLRGLRAYGPIRAPIRESNSTGLTGPYGIPYGFKSRGETPGGRPAGGEPPRRRRDRQACRRRAASPRCLRRRGPSGVVACRPPGRRRRRSRRKVRRGEPVRHRFRHLSRLRAPGGCDGDEARRLAAPIRGLAHGRHQH